VHLRDGRCLSDVIVTEWGLVVVGNVSPSRLAKTNMAKSALDAGWAGKRLRTASCVLRSTSPIVSTRICSECGALSGPKSIADLGIRD
jgi:putative transposase